MMNSFSHDIIIVGGGMVGLTLACALAQHTSLSIAVLEAQLPTHPFTPSHYFHRVSAIALSSQRIFKSLGVWDRIREKRVSPFTRIEVWDAQGGGDIQFESKEIAEPLLGYIIENNIIQSVLEEKIKHFSQVEFISPLSLTTFNEKENAVELIAQDGRVFKAKLAVAADGAHSWLRREAGFDLDKHDYQQEALVAMVTTEKPHERIARQVFLPQGPLAFLPLAMENLSSIVWSLPTEEAKRWQRVEENHFKEKLANAFSHCLGDIIKVEQRYSFPLHKQQVKTYVKSRVVLAGDAAHTIHPLAGQGVNMGLLDAASLAEVILDAVNKRRDFASTHTLRQYERWRKADNFFLLTGVDMIKNLFASHKKSIQLLRSFGLKATNRTDWVKNIFTQHAVGDRHGLPKMAQR